jgi:hypothetical protein
MARLRRTLNEHICVKIRKNLITCEPHQPRGIRFFLPRQAAHKRVGFNPLEAKGTLEIASNDLDERSRGLGNDLPMWKWDVRFCP